MVSVKGRKGTVEQRLFIVALTLSIRTCPACGYVCLFFFEKLKLYVEGKISKERI